MEQDVLCVSHISKAIKCKQILDDVSFTIGPGQAIGLIGPNGSGKSSLMKCISTAYRTDTGSIQIMSHDVESDHVDAMKNTGMAIENPALFDNLSGMDHLKLYASYKGCSSSKEQLASILDWCDLHDDIYKKVGGYSIGMKQRLALGIAFLNNPKLILLDEPTNGLDPESVFKLRKLLSSQKEKGTSLLVTSHVLGDLEKICDQFLFIQNGRIIDSIERSQIKNRFHSYGFEVENEQAASQILEPWIQKQQGQYFQVEFPDASTFAEAVNDLSSATKIMDIYRIESDLEALYKKIYGDENDRNT